MCLFKAEWLQWDGTETSIYNWFSMSFLGLVLAEHSSAGQHPIGCP